jgi:hypothetical protein
MGMLIDLFKEWWLEGFEHFRRLQFLAEADAFVVLGSGDASEERRVGNAIHVTFISPSSKS